MFFYLTNVILDIGTGVVWWTLKNTTYGAYKGIEYMLYSKKEIKKDENNDLLKEIKLLRKELADVKQI